MENKLSIYVITHKKVDLTKLKLDSCYKKLMVGKKKEEIDEKNILLDSTDDNISYKNSNYCELTGLYWMWKNDKSDYIGLCHYGRFLTNNRFKILRGKNILHLLNKYDVIVPLRARYFGKNATLYEKYKRGHIISDLDECRNIISEKYPEYINSFDKIMNGKTVYFKNMFIMKKQMLDDYCEWLFSILGELEKRVDLNGRDNLQKRVFGFMSERLFTVWLDHNNLKKYECVIYQTEHKSIRYYIKTILRMLWIY